MLQLLLPRLMTCARHLAVISGYVELLVTGKLGNLNEKQQRVMEDMHVSSNRLQRLVNDFLTFSSLETGCG